MRLHDKTNATWDAVPFVVRISTDPGRAEPLRLKEALVIANKSQTVSPGFRAYFDCCGLDNGKPLLAPVITLPSELAYVSDGDIVAVRPLTGDLRVLYRKRSAHNSLLLTEQCNNYCVMCSQPPRKNSHDDSVMLVEDAIPLMDIDTPELTLTGGEPTLLRGRLVDLIRKCRNFLPHTAIHVLTNGRLLRYLAFAQDIADVHHPDLVLGIPLYSDVSHQHDGIVQAPGAFDETVRGILNAARCNIRVELRIVITKLNYEYLPRISTFIARNFPFTCNVAFMGMEVVGLARPNLANLWIDPIDYSHLLVTAVRELGYHCVPVSVYNHQLCTLPTELWRHSRRSISDWKNIFIDECQSCGVREQCGGFFECGAMVHSRHIKALPPIWEEATV